MGQPEDYIIEEDNHDTHSYSGAAPRKQKIIPRYWKGMISGVSAGLGHYFELMPYGLEYFYSTSMGSGTGVLAYIIYGLLFL
jgi:phage shock protein PspC (stress-responsive transcriptional regulator)